MLPNQEKNKESLAKQSQNSQNPIPQAPPFPVFTKQEIPPAPQPPKFTLQQKRRNIGKALRKQKQQLNSYNEQQQPINSYEQSEFVATGNNSNLPLPPYNPVINRPIWEAGPPVAPQLPNLEVMNQIGNYKFQKKQKKIQEKKTREQRDEQVTKSLQKAVDYGSNVQAPPIPSNKQLE